MLDASGGLTSSYNYDPYGTSEGTSLPQDYGFTGEPQNSTTGLVHLRARWYSTVSGRFISRDPFGGELGNPLSMNPYQYGELDPVGNTDHSGLCTDKQREDTKKRARICIEGIDPFEHLYLDDPTYPDYGPGTRNFDYWSIPRTLGQKLWVEPMTYVKGWSESYVAFQREVAQKLCPWGGCNLALAAFFARKGGGFGGQSPGVWIPKPSSGTVIGAYCPIWPRIGNSLFQLPSGYIGSERQLGPLVIPSKPYQIHHYASNKHDTKYTTLFRQIAAKYGLDLDGAWNKERLPHIGSHPTEYHEFVLREMQEADRVANGNLILFLLEFEARVKQPVRNDPSLLDKAGWRGR
ncbi:MAG TPA: RHS repeat-associated core domain-containing protein [Chloroflexia bacterium]|nr:RHS repeat-associated core domain-containing protein [Chloroflexia bacterium]